MPTTGDLRARLLVMDTGPLITLAAAASLDYLLYPGIPVFIPDAVVFEAARDENALESLDIVDWLQANTGQVQTLTTETFINYVRQAETGGPYREKDLGERAALEAVEDAMHLEEHERALMMTEDDRALRRVLVVNAELTSRVIPITTRDFLDGLEAAGRIQSADEVYRMAQDAGRAASQRRVLAEQQSAAIQAVRRVLQR